MSVLNIILNASGGVASANVDGNDIGPVQSLSQNLVNGELVAVITSKYDTINVADGTPAPALTVAYAGGTAADSTAGTITGSPGAGNRFAYKISIEELTHPVVSEIVPDTTDYTSGNDIPNVASGNYVNMYELDSEDRVVKYDSHELQAGEIT